MFISPIRIALLVCLIAGLYRLWPALAGQPALSEFFITEDGYLMLTVARNIAIGLGMSVSEGTIATNGIQPMATFLFTIPYLLTDGDRVVSLMGIHIILAAIGVGALFAIQALAARLLLPWTEDPVWPWLVAALWFASPLLLRHSMNGLETGLVTLTTALVLVQFHRVVSTGAGVRRGDTLLLGALCGLTFLARIDTAILSVAVFAVWGLDALIRQRIGIVTTIGHLLPAGLVCLLIAAPWLLNNLLAFGSLMPISGPAQSLNATFAGHADLIPATLFEYLFPMLPIPGGVARNPVLVVALSIVAAAILGWFWLWVAVRGQAAERAVVLAFSLHGVALVGYYGLFFGADHFLSRYLAPFAPLLIVAALAAAMDLGRVLGQWARPTLFPGIYGFGGLALSLLLLGRLLLPGSVDQGHSQVVAWVGENVSEDTWIGAVQTGTLGYWHDRTINLDGKVNPAALDARRTDGHVLRYVVESDIEYIVDWVGVGGTWAERTDAEFSNRFDLILMDPETNLSVMRRSP
jgi:hypothetical protein